MIDDLRRPAPGRPGLGAWAARACSSRRCRPRCSTGAPTSPSTRPRTCRPATPRAWSLAAVPARADPRDALVGSRLADLAPGALVATGSVRRRAQLAWVRPDLTFAGLRGNIATRLRTGPRGRRRRRGRRRPGPPRPARTGPPRSSTVASCCPRSGRAPSRVECRADDERDPGRRWRRSTIPPPATGGDGRTGLSGPTRRRLRSAGRGLRPARRRGTDGRDLRRGHAGFARRTSWSCARRSTRPGRAHRPRSGRALADAAARGRRRPTSSGRASSSRPGRVTVYLVGAGPGDPGLLTVRGAEVLRRRRRGRPRPAGGCPPPRPGARRGPAHRRRQGTGRPGPPGRDQRPPGPARAGPAGRWSGSRAAIRSCSAGAARRPWPCRRPACRSRWCPASPSAIAVPAYAGVPVTHRGLSTSFTVVTGHSRHAVDRETNWEALAAAGGTIVVLMGVAHRAPIADRLMAGGLAPDTPVLAVHWGTRPEQRSGRIRLDRARRHAARTAGHARDRGRRRARPGLVRAAPALRPPGRGHPGPVPGLGACPALPAGARRPADRGADHPHRPAGRRRRRPGAGGVGIWRRDATTGWCSARPTPSTALLAHLADARSFGPARIAAIGPGTAGRPGPLADRARPGPRPSHGRRPAGGLPRPARARGPGAAAREPPAGRDVLPDGLGGRGLARRRGRGVPDGAGDA